MLSRFRKTRSSEYRCNRAQYADNREKIQLAYSNALSVAKGLFASEVNSYFRTFTSERVLDITEKLLELGYTGVILQIESGIPTDTILASCEEYKRAVHRVLTATGGTWELRSGYSPGSFILAVNEATLPLAMLYKNVTDLKWMGKPIIPFLDQTTAREIGVDV